MQRLLLPDTADDQAERCPLCGETSRRSGERRGSILLECGPCELTFDVLNPGAIESRRATAQTDLKTAPKKKPSTTNAGLFEVDSGRRIPAADAEQESFSPKDHARDSSYNRALSPSN